MNSPVAAAVKGIIDGYRDGLEAGQNLERQKIATILAAYHRAMDDSETKIPTYLHAVIAAAGKDDGRGQRAVVEARRGCSSTEYTIKGDLQSVLWEIASFFVNYHPHGYGTYVHGISMEADRSYTARLSHSNSCD